MARAVRMDHPNVNRRHQAIEKLDTGVGQNCDVC